MPEVTRTVNGIGAVTLTGQGPFSRQQTGGVSGGYGLVGYDGLEAEVNVDGEKAKKIYAKTSAALAELDAIINDFNPIFPTNTVAPAITGLAESGETLTVSNGTWTGEASITYARKWYADGVLIAGQTAATLVLAADHVGKKISAVVTATNARGIGVASSAETAVVVA